MITILVILINSALSSPARGRFNSSLTLKPTATPSAPKSFAKSKKGNVNSEMAHEDQEEQARLYSIL
eukprot:74229-Prorocentrum_lima.AAC.1